MRKLHETVGETRAIFRDAWVPDSRRVERSHLTAAARTFHSALTLPVFRVAVRRRAGNAWKSLPQMVSAIRDRRCDISRSLADP